MDDMRQGKVILGHAQCLTIGQLDVANEIVKYLEGLLGRPNDPTFGIVVIRGRKNACVRNPVLREYTIMISRKYLSDEQVFASLAHEVYHRFTMNRQSMRQQLWVDEMLAFGASDEVLRHFGYVEYAEYRLLQQLEQEAVLPVSRLIQMKRGGLSSVVRNLRTRYLPDENLTLQGVI